MTSLDSFIECLKENVDSNIPIDFMGLFRDRLISELYEKNGDFTLNNFLDFLENLKVGLGKKEKTMIGDLRKPENREWWAKALGKNLEKRDELIIKKYQAIFKPGNQSVRVLLKKIKIQDELRHLRDCLNAELELKKPQYSPLSDVSSHDLSSEPEPETLSEFEPEPEQSFKPMMKTKVEELTREEQLKLLQNREWTQQALMSIGRKKKIKKTKKRKKSKKKKKKKTKRRTKH